MCSGYDLVSLVNRQTHTHTQTGRQTLSTGYILVAQPGSLITHSTSSMWYVIPMLECSCIKKLQQINFKLSQSLSSETSIMLRTE